MKSFAARSSVSAGGSVYSSSVSKKKSLRKSSKQYGSSNGSGHVGSNSGVSPLALPSVTDSEKVEKQTPKSVSSLPPIVDQTELEDVKEDSTLLDSGKSKKNRHKLCVTQSGNVIFNNRTSKSFQIVETKVVGYRQIDHLANLAFLRSGSFLTNRLLAIVDLE